MERLQGQGGTPLPDAPLPEKTMLFLVNNTPVSLLRVRLTPLQPRPIPTPAPGQA